MSSLKDIITDIRIFLYGGLRVLPLTIAGTFLILGLMTANYAMLFFVIGFLIFIPLIAYAINLIAGLIGLDSYFNTSQTDVCTLVIPFVTNAANSVKSDTSMTFSSLWVSLMSFFFGYMISNGISLYSRPAFNNEISVTSTPPSGVSTRTSQSLISILTTVFIFIAVMGYRYYTGCETKLGMLISICIFGALGHTWYYLLSSVGQDRLSDLFGIANRLLSQTAIQNSPIACVPIKV
jgi:hypothetical protein